VGEAKKVLTPSSQGGRMVTVQIGEAPARAFHSINYSSLSDIEGALKSSFYFLLWRFYDP